MTFSFHLSLENVRVLIQMLGFHNQTNLQIYWGGCFCCNLKLKSFDQLLINQMVTCPTSNTLKDIEKSQLSGQLAFSSYLFHSRENHFLDGWGS